MTRSALMTLLKLRLPIFADCRPPLPARPLPLRGLSDRTPERRLGARDRVRAGRTVVHGRPNVPQGAHHGPGQDHKGPLERPKACSAPSDALFSQPDGPEYFGVLPGAARFLLMPETGKLAD